MGAAFDAADLVLAEQLVAEIKSADATTLVSWKLGSTVGNLKDAVKLIEDPALRQRFDVAVGALEELKA